MLNLTTICCETACHNVAVASGPDLKPRCYRCLGLYLVSEHAPGIIRDIADVLAEVWGEGGYEADLTSRLSGYGLSFRDVDEERRTG